MRRILLRSWIPDGGKATEAWGRWTPGSGAPRGGREDLLRRKEVVQEGKNRSVVFPSWKVREKRKEVIAQKFHPSHTPGILGLAYAPRGGENS